MNQVTIVEPTIYMVLL